MIVIILINAVTLHNHSVHTPQLPKNNNVLCLRIVLEWFVGRGVGPEYKEPGRSNWEMPPLLARLSLGFGSRSSSNFYHQGTNLPPPTPRSISFLQLMPRVQSRADPGTKKNMNGE